MVNIVSWYEHSLNFCLTLVIERLKTRHQDYLISGDGPSPWFPMLTASTLYLNYLWVMIPYWSIIPHTNQLADPGGLRAGAWVVCHFPKLVLPSASVSQLVPPLVPQPRFAQLSPWRSHRVAGPERGGAFRQCPARLDAGGAAERCWVCGGVVVA